MSSAKVLGALRLTVRKLAIDPTDLIRVLPNDAEATLVRARAEAQQHFERTKAEYVKIFLHITKGQGSVRGERYFCLDPETDRMLPGHSSQLVETHTREEYLAKKHQTDPPESSAGTRDRTKRETRGDTRRSRRGRPG
jgi:hypothetical protein